MALLAEPQTGGRFFRAKIGTRTLRVSVFFVSRMFGILEQMPAANDTCSVAKMLLDGDAR